MWNVHLLVITTVGTVLLLLTKKKNSLAKIIDTKSTCKLNNGMSIIFFDFVHCWKLWVILKSNEKQEKISPKIFYRESIKKKNEHKWILMNSNRFLIISKLSNDVKPKKWSDRQSSLNSVIYILKDFKLKKKLAKHLFFVNKWKMS